MNRTPGTSTFRKIVSGTMIFLMVHVNAWAASTDIATSPLVTSPQTSVLPNLMFILDDSGSMDSDYVPDWANSSSNFRFQNVDYNGVAYDPGVTYSAPVYYTAAGALDTTTYPAMSGTNTQASCGAAYCAVKNDGYGIQSTGTTDLRTIATYFTFIAGEYCTSANLRTCTAQTAPTAANPFPAVLRWCTTSGNASAVTPASGTCQASRIENGTTYMNARHAGQNRPTATITVTGTTATTVSSIQINGKEILSGTTSSATAQNTAATNIQSNINNCTSSTTGNCTIAGYSASRSNNVVTISAPADQGTNSAFVPYTPVVTKSGTMTVVPTAFVSGSPAGHNLRVDIVSGNNSYPYPGSAAKATSRTDCAGTTCTYTEEMNNYANWWAYYRTRMQMMKTAGSIAFQPVDTKYRVGFTTINHNVSGSFLNLGTFNATQKKAWYDKFFASNPNNSTPLRQALSVVGRLYAGKLNGSTISSVTVTDPMQYSCQQNFTLLTTDGYWNGSAGFQLDGSTAVGNQDGVEPRPQNDGANLIVVTVTPSVTTVRKQTLQGIQETTAWARTNTTIGSTCTIAAGTAPTSCVTDNGNNSANSTRKWCMVSTNSGQSGECSGAVGSTVYACRGITNSSNLPNTGSPTACKTDGNGDNWCVYTSSSPAGASSCQLALSGDNVYICKVTAAVSGKNVTVTNQSYNQVRGGAVGTSIDDVATTTNSSVTSTNGVAAPSVPNTPAPTTTTTNVSTSATSYSTDNGVPTGATTWTNGSVVSGPTCVATASLPAAGGSTPSSGTPAVSNVGSATISTVSTTGPVVGTPTVSSTSASGGTSDTLADVAEYYYLNDLRTTALGNCTGAIVSPATVGLDVCSNDVAGSGLDAASYQHMTTFTLGLANGNMLYNPTYQTSTVGDFFDVKNGSVANAANGICGWQADGTSCNWPIPASDSQNNIDDLWHAAVNGRGQYFQATSPSALSQGLSSTLAGVNARTGSSAAATTSNPNVTSGDNFVFSSTFTTNEWDGQLVRQQLDLVSGAVSSTIDWSSQGQLDLLAYGSRLLYNFDSTNSTTTNTKLKLFTYANLASANQAYFNTANITGLSQFCSSGVTCLASADQTAAAGAPLVNFIRGDRSNEGVATDTTKYFRNRVHVLGDVVNAEAVYVKGTLFGYADSGYTAFGASGLPSSRTGMVYVASNDGILHGFNATTGAEAFGYVPTAVMPNLYKLADKNYTAQHRYFVDGTPAVGDAYFGSAWHTILVGGLNSGGNAYYALDVTDPTNIKALWEFTDTNLGLAYGNPVITKLSDGTWVVLLTSGYNNNGTGQDGIGRLYVVNAGTGALIRTISTGVGSVTTPSGLAKVNAWVDNTTTDNTALRAYGGDLLGNVWRFDINGNVGAAGYDAQKLITLYADGGPAAAGTTTQPITTKPELGDVAGVAVVYVGTGKYLGTTDLSDTTQQTFYAIKDALGSTTLGNPRITTNLFVKQVATNTTCPAGSPSTICTTGQKVRTSTANTVNFASNNGWYIDLPDSGERANTDPTLALGTIGFTTNAPNTSVCTAGGTSFRWLLDYRSGAPVSTSTTGVSSISLGNALATRAVFVRLPNNTVVQLTRMSDGTTVTTNVPIGGGASATRRVSWRELIQDQ